jgi:hypothetical protein
MTIIPVYIKQLSCTKDFPVVVQVESSSQFSITPVWSGSKFKGKTIHADDPDLDISTCPLGYFQQRSGDYNVAYYIERLPLRKWRQGICTTNVNLTILVAGSHKPSMRGSTPFWCEGFEKMVQNEYESFDKALKLLQRDDYRSVPISRNVALSKSEDIISVFIKKDECGWIQNKSSLIKIPKNREVEIRLISKYLNGLKWEFA